MRGGKMIKYILIGLFIISWNSQQCLADTGNKAPYLGNNPSKAAEELATAKKPIKKTIYP